MDRRCTGRVSRPLLQVDAANSSNTPIGSGGSALGGGWLGIRTCTCIRSGLGRSSFERSEVEVSMSGSGVVLSFTTFPLWRLESLKKRRSNSPISNIEMDSAGTDRSAPGAALTRVGRDDDAFRRCQAAAFTGILTVCSFTLADLGRVIFSTPLAKCVFTVLGSGSKGRVIERANLPKVRS